MTWVSSGEVSHIHAIMITMFVRYGLVCGGLVMMLGVVSALSVTRIYLVAKVGGVLNIALHLHYILIIALRFHALHVRSS